MAAILVDTGFLVSLFRRSDRLRTSARDFLRENHLPLITAMPVIVETCFFLDAEAKCSLLAWIQRRALSVSEVPVAAYGSLIVFLRKYADRDADLADAALVWLADQTGIRGVLTTDVTDFAVYRLKGGKRFEIMGWFG